MAVQSSPQANHEPRWHAALAVLGAAALQFFLPPRLSLGPAWVMPLIVLAMLVPLLIFSPSRHQETKWQRIWSIALIAIVNLFNLASVLLLVFHIVHPQLHAVVGTQLLVAGGQIWLSNVLVFGLWFWEIDGGGPEPRAHAHSEAELRDVDFLFPQMTLAGNKARCIDATWKPLFLDYLYVAFTNALAFSPTDTMPLTRSAKMLMLLESGISFVAIAVVVSRSINIIS